MVKNNLVDQVFLQKILETNFPHITFNYNALWVLFKEVERWGSKLSLTHAIGEELLYKHLIDSVLPIDYFLKLNPKTVLDIGSGAGFPGLVLASIMSETKFILSDLREKRRGFLIATSALMGLKNVEVISDGLAKNSNIDKFDIATFRALTQLDNRFLNKVFATSHKVLAYKGSYSKTSTETKDLKYHSQLITLKPIGISEERTLLVIADN